MDRQPLTCLLCGRPMEHSVNWVGGRGYLSGYACTGRHADDPAGWCGYGELSSGFENKEDENKWRLLSAN